MRVLTQPDATRHKTLCLHWQLTLAMAMKVRRVSGCSPPCGLLKWRNSDPAATNLINFLCVIVRHCFKQLWSNEHSAILFHLGPIIISRRQGDHPFWELNNLKIMSRQVHLSIFCSKCLEDQSTKNLSFSHVTCDLMYLITRMSKELESNITGWSIKDGS